MILIIDLPDEQEAALKAKAKTHGISAEQYAVQVLQKDLGAASPSSPARKSATDKAREFVEWAKNHPFTPPLSDEAISRASLNPDRW